MKRFIRSHLCWVDDRSDGLNFRVGISAPGPKF